MLPVLRTPLRPLTSLSTARRWVHLILGGVVLFPYLLAATVLVALLRTESVAAAVIMVSFLVVLPVLTAFVPVVRTLEGTAARVLLGGRVAELVVAEARTWPDRLRTAAWFCSHLWVGFFVAIATMVVLTDVAVSFLIPFVGVDTNPVLGGQRGSPGLGVWQRPMPAGWSSWWTPFAGLGLLVALLYLVAGVGAVPARLAPVLLGPSPTERLAHAERRAADLAERNRLARELHDSVGHALSVVTLQAGAAGRVLDTDPTFARGALGAIEASARTALEDLDHVLGVLREEATTAPQPTLRDLDRLLRTTRSAGVEVDAHVSDGVDQLPRAVSREAYRIAQEGLTNVLRHAGKVPVTLRIAVRGDRLGLEMTNPLRSADVAAAGADGRGRGLRGIEERVTVLGGEMDAGAEGGRWRVAVSLPLRSAS